MIAVTDTDAAVLLDRDENVRPGTTAEKLAELPAAFAAWGAKGGDQGWDAQLCRQYGLAAIDHVHHAGNSSGVVDGAGAVVIASPVRRTYRVAPG